MAERRVGNPGRIWAEMARGGSSPFYDPNAFIPGLEGQAEDPGYPGNYWQQKVAEAAKRVLAPVGDSAYNAWQGYLDQQQKGTLAEKLLDPNIARWLGVGREPEAVAAPVPSAEQAATVAPQNLAPPSGPGGSPTPLPPPNPYMEALAQMVLRAPGSDDMGSLPRLGGGNYPAPLNQSMNMPAFPSRPVPQRGQSAEPDYSLANEYLEAARPKDYEPNKSDMIVAILGGAASGFGDWRPGERLGAQIARAGSGTMGAYMNQKRYQEGRQDQAEERKRGYNMQRGGIEEGREGQRVARTDRNAEITYQNETAQREDEFRRADYEIKTQQIQNELAAGNWNRAFAIAQQMRADDRTNMQIGLQEKELGMRADQAKMSGLASLARIQAAGNRPGAKTLADLGPAGAVANIVSDAIGKNKPIPGYDISQLQTTALAEAKGNKELQQTFALNPQLQQSWVKQRVAAMISQDLASNPQKMQQILALFGKMPLGNNTTIMRGLDPDGDE